MIIDEDAWFVIKLFGGSMICCALIVGACVYLSEHTGFVDGRFLITVHNADGTTDRFHAVQYKWANERQIWLRTADNTSAVVVGNFTVTSDVVPAEAKP